MTDQAKKISIAATAIASLEIPSIAILSFFQSADR